MGPDVMILDFLTSAYLRLLIFPLAILIPAGNSSIRVALLMISSIYKVNTRVTINSLLYPFLSLEPVRSVNISPPSGNSFPPILSNLLQSTGVTEYGVELPVLYSSLPPAVCLHAVMCVSTLLSQFIPPSPFSLCSQACSLCLHLYSCPANRFISTIFLDSIYMH